MSSSVGKVVCVTDASGYIASWIVKFLLHGGYTVKATVRDPNDPKKIDHLLKLDGAKERLQLFKANLLEEGSFDSVVQGCYGVFHTASPFYHDVKDPQAELIDPALKGTLSVLKSCAKSPSLKRVVLTSSMAAVAYNGKPRTPDVVVDDTWFTDPDLSRESNVCAYTCFLLMLRNMFNIWRVFLCSGMGRSGSEETVMEKKERCEFLLACTEDNLFFIFGKWVLC
ncbi:cinnamoyl-CoA reductase CAD2-like [Vicia villosa]|uniref:cinnamoyl-CoA reductase CAD2-like n=1 Tax=Vicia villosa TaxID=3911 RepID=UPI00273C6CED|nr:cinnamoyl-CoA reductase CAD2-like [Vicia villosa]